MSDRHHNSQRIEDGLPDDWSRARRYHWRHKMSGLCWRCNQPAVFGQTQCEEHREWQRIYDVEVWNKKRSEWRRAKQGISG